MTTASHDIPLANRTVRSLPLELWPQADRNAWNTACQPATRLKRGGAAGHLKPVTRDDHAAHYGNFLGFLNRSGLLALHEPAAANVTPEKVNAYIDELQGRVASTTLHGSICRLRRAAYSRRGSTTRTGCFSQRKVGISPDPAAVPIRRWRAR
jgi:hypothetical protein